MRLHRFIGNFNFKNRFLEIFDKDLYNQTKKVLRLEVGDKFFLSDGRLNEALVRIASFDKNFLKVEIISVRQNINEPKIRVILYCSILKRENFELVVQKATEVGVAEIIPITAKRTVKLSLKRERLKKIIREAAEQAGRGIIPAISQPLDFEKAIRDAEHNDINLFFEITGRMFNKKKVSLESSRRVGVFVGPEGGWDEVEIKMAQEKNFQVVSLGKLTLRAETAAIVASYLVASAKN